MTVRTVPARRFSREDRREHVLAYVSTRHGFKTQYLAEHQISYWQMNSWRKALADGDLDRGLVPRHTGSMSKDDVAEIRRLQSENARLEKERDQAVGDLDRMRTAADALGKAIGVMQKQHGAISDEDEQR